MRIRTVRNANPQSLNQVFKILTNENVQHKTKPREFRLSMKSKSIGNVDKPLSSFSPKKDNSRHPCQCKRSTSNEVNKLKYPYYELIH